MFDKIPENRNIPDDIFLIKELKDKENHTHYAPSIFPHENTGSAINETDLEEILPLRSMPVENEYLVDIAVRNNSYMPVPERFVYLYYVSKDKACSSKNWEQLKTLSGMPKAKTHKVFPCQDSFTEESFVVTADENTPYYLIAALDNESGEIRLPEEPVNLNQLNESYYWCILDSEEIMV